MTKSNRPSLFALLGDKKGSSIVEMFEKTQAAGEVRLIPAGSYRCLVDDVQVSEAKTGTPSVRLTLVVDDGEQKGTRLWHRLWLTAAAMPMTKRDLAKLEITRLDDLSFHPGTVVAADVGVETGDDGVERNVIKMFEVVGRLGDPIEDPEFGQEDDE